MGITDILSIGTKIADKIWMDKGEKAKLEFDKESMTNSFQLAVMEAHKAGDLAEFEDEKDRRADIRQSGWLSRQVRPVIALTFHGFIWWVILFEHEPTNISARLGLILFEWNGMKVTLGMAYFLIVIFYFLTKGIKDYFISKNPVSGVVGNIIRQ